jgi:hypothetical protein
MKSNRNYATFFANKRVFDEEIMLFFDELFINHSDPEKHNKDQSLGSISYDRVLILLSKSIQLRETTLFLSKIETYLN